MPVGVSKASTVLPRGFALSETPCSLCSLCIYLCKWKLTLLSPCFANYSKGEIFCYPLLTHEHHKDHIFLISSSFFFFFLYLQHTKVPEQGTELELQLQPMPQLQQHRSLTHCSIVGTLLNFPLSIPALHPAQNKLVTHFESSFIL